jgi:hypothetical protein
MSIRRLIIENKIDISTIVVKYYKYCARNRKFFFKMLANKYDHKLDDILVEAAKRGNSQVYRIAWKYSDHSLEAYTRVIEELSVCPPEIKNKMIKLAADLISHGWEE